MRASVRVDGWINGRGGGVAFCDPLHLWEGVALHEGQGGDAGVEVHRVAPQAEAYRRAEGQAEGRAEGRAEGGAEGRAEGRAEGQPHLPEWR